MSVPLKQQTTSKGDVSLIPKLCLGTQPPKLCFEAGRETEFRDVRSQTEFGNEVSRGERQPIRIDWDEFADQIHASLDPTEIALLVANEGRRLTGTDRLSVGLRRGKRLKVEAVSGTDLVEPQS